MTVIKIWQVEIQNKGDTSIDLLTLFIDMIVEGRGLGNGFYNRHE